ncbi:methyl-accepting chemotaxis protein [Roseateles sp. DC23W]|uniref:Methyl-accepting chemotaxis protein n=1 Tax=Pelomonas dachongensis TaxID=3299029 RepID=A0ABW7EPC5_9BURK
MRVNQPVTQREFDFPADATLMSTTDTQSYVKYANDAFIAVSGFSRDEVIGQPHNLVRHPDMPEAAFEDMWGTLKGGEPWTGFVKNRRKDGDHYWVRANAVPIVRGGRTQGFMSVRTRATREESAAAEQLYADLRDGRASGVKLHKGLIVRTGLASLLSWRQTMGVRARIRLTLALMGLAMLLVGIPLSDDVTALAKLAALVGVAMVVTSIVFEQTFARPLEQLRETALAVATGAQQEVTSMDRVDEIGMSMRCISQLGLMFRWLVSDVSEQVMNVQTAVNEIAKGNEDLSSRTEQAASSLQQTASSMEEMTATVKNNADTALQANELSGQASEAAAHGGQAVSQVVSRMGDISASSRKIADIIGTIDGIAFQTNILALNAAVEAARAGEQGRGFAVVAGEVRLLAQRSAEAAKEIKTLINASVEQVDAGSRLVDDAGQAMGEIVAKVQRVSHLIGEISGSIREQSSGIGQVGQAVSHLDQVTQQNAALVEQSSAASMSLKQQTASLVEAVGVFR